MLRGVHRPYFPGAFGMFGIAFVDKYAEREGSQNDLYDDTYEADELAGLDGVI